MFLRFIPEDAFGYSLVIAIWFFIQCLCPNLFLYSSIRENLAFWHFFNVINNVLMHVVVHRPPWTRGWESYAVIHLEVESAGGGVPSFSYV